MATSWRAISAGYRVLVAIQTLGWAVAAFVNISRRSTVARAEHLYPVVLTGTATLFLLGGVANHVWRRRRPSLPLYRSLIRSWLALQLGGALALAAFMVSASNYSFLVGVAALSLMHFLSPNRFQNG